MTEMATNTEKLCCIAHSFCRAASSNPNRIAVVHALGGFRISTGQDERISDEEFILSHPEVESPPIYPGDVFYTFGELQSAVNALASRITNVLAGGDDPDLMTPTGFALGERDKDVHCEGNSNIGLMGSERANNQNIMAYKDIPNPICISKHSMGEQAGEHIGYYSSPQIVGIYLVPSVEYIVAILAVLRSGAAFLPLDPSWPKERVLGIASASKVCLILSYHHASGFHACENHELEWLLRGSTCPILYLLDRCAKGFIGQNKSECEMSWPCQSKEQRSFCYVMHTSGSTGKPKGVCGTEEGLLNRYMWMETIYPLLAHDVSCFNTTISFIDHFSEILGPLLSCTPLVIPPFDEFKRNPLSLVDIVKAYRVTRLTTVPSLMRALLPAIQSSSGGLIQKFLRVLVLSGEAFPIWLWESLHRTLTNTSILNLYGTTEVSGDSAYFDCKNLPKLLDDQLLNSVPIGKAILGCELMLVADTDSLDSLNTEGEICVGGKCLALGYLDDAVSHASKFVNLNYCADSSSEVQDSLFFRTGDFARKLSDDNYVFLGRKDRMVKVNGQLIALEEIEYNLRKHPNVADVAASFYYGKRGDTYITAYIVLKGVDQSFPYSASSEQNHHSHVDEDTETGSDASWRNWLQERLPSAMMPHKFLFIETLPLSPSGKIDYAALRQIEPSVQGTEKARDGIQLEDGAMQIIKKAFRRVLMVEVVSDYDDFFSFGGNSISAAHIAHSLGIDMHFIYKHPSPHKLYSAMQQIPGLLESISGLDVFSKPPPELRDGGKGKDISRVSHLSVCNMSTGAPSLANVKHQDALSISGVSGEEAQMLPKRESSIMHTLGQSGIGINNSRRKNYILQPHKRQCFQQFQTQMASTMCMTNTMGGGHWISHLNLPEAVAFTRCNRVISPGQFDNHSVLQNSCAIFRNVLAGSMRQLWKVLLHSCVDASPLVVKWCDKCYLFIGSHAHNFLCIDAVSGEVQWEVELGGRVECTAALTDDFTQVVVGCYNGTIYFLEFLSGKTLWSFQTGGEVKSQPIMDKLRGLVWCGSYDHNIYALDARCRRCVFKIPCGGSVFGAPVYDMVRSKIYVAATSGRVTAVNLEGTAFKVSWSYESESPIFGSLAMEPRTGYGKNRRSDIFRSMHFSLSILSGTGVLKRWICVLF